MKSKTSPLDPLSGVPERGKLTPTKVFLFRLPSPLLWRGVGGEGIKKIKSKTSPLDPLSGVPERGNSHLRKFFYFLFNFI